MRNLGRRGAVGAAVFALTAALGFAGASTGPVRASNDSYCGHGTGHVAYHQAHTNRWRNVWAQHSPPYPGASGHWNHYIKQRQPSYYPGTSLAWLWFEDGQLWRTNCE